MVAVLADQIVGIPSVLSAKLLHHRPHLIRPHLRLPNHHRLPEPEPFAPLRFPFEYPRRRVLVSPERVLHTVNCTHNNNNNNNKLYFRRSENGSLQIQGSKIETLHPRMVHSKAEPVGVAVDGGQIVHIQIHRLRS